MCGRDYAGAVHNSMGVVGSVGVAGAMMVVLPWIKWGPNQKKGTTDELLMAEACALAASLPAVTVVHQVGGPHTIYVQDT